MAAPTYDDIPAAALTGVAKEAKAPLFISTPSNKQYWWCQLAFWGAFACANLAMFVMSGTAKPIMWTVMLVWTPAQLVASHCLRYFFKGFTQRLSLLTKIIVTAALIITLSLAVQLLIYCVIKLLSVFYVAGIAGMAPYSVFAFLSYTVNTALALGLWVVCYLSVQQFRLRRHTELAYWKAQAQLRDSELQFLHSQINSHFLFNAMNNVRALILENPQLARDRLTQLASLLRSTLSAGEKELVSLKEEFELVRAYLDLEDLQYENRLHVSWQIAAASEACMIPPMVLQTLVENAIKHGIAQSATGGTVTISSVVKDANVEISIQNPVAHARHAGQGLGLRNTQLRLQKVFAQRARLTTKQDADVFTATLLLPL